MDRCPYICNNKTPEGYCKTTACSNQKVINEQLQPKTTTYTTYTIQPPNRQQHSLYNLKEDPIDITEKTTADVSHKNPVKLFSIEGTTLSFQAGLTVFVGCNSSGKSHLIQELIYVCYKEDIPYFCYDDRGNDTMTNMEFISYKIGNFIKQNIYADDIFIFFDNLDHGLTVDNILLVHEFFDQILMDTEKEACNVYIIVTANTYEMAEGKNCYDVMHRKPIMFSDYKGYRKFIINSAKELKKRR